MMRALARGAVERPLSAWLLILFSLLGGAFGYLDVGKLEDPVLTLRQALVVTAYPGARAAEVGREVSEVLEAEIQQMSEVESITSRNSPGVSVIEVEIREQYDGAELPQVWDHLCHRMAMAAPSLPPGARPPVVNDDFSDAFGLF